MQNTILVESVADNYSSIDETVRFILEKLSTCIYYFFHNVFRKLSFSGWLKYQNVGSRVNIQMQEWFIMNHLNSLPTNDKNFTLLSWAHRPFCRQCRSWSDCTFCAVWSWSTLIISVFLNLWFLSLFRYKYCEKRNQHFLLFPQCFQTSSLGSLKVWIVW